MKKRFVISNTPTKLPINSTILYTFLMWYFKVDNLYWGIFICFFGLLWILTLISLFTQEIVDLNATKEDGKAKLKQSRFAERLNELMKREQ